MTTTAPTLAWSEGCHSNKTVDDAYASGGFRAVFAVKGGINDARATGARTIIDRFPGTRYGETPHLTQFLRCADDDWVQAVKSLTSFSLFHKRCAYIAYLRGMSDLPQSTESERFTGVTVMRHITAILRGANARCIVEGTPRNAFEWDMLNGLIACGLYAGTEPYWDKGATALHAYPCLQEEAKLASDGISVDGSKWNTNYRPFGKYTPAPMLLMSDRKELDGVPLAPLRDRIAEAQRWGWSALPYCHQYKLAVTT